MARGWESKSVESQQDDARGARTSVPALTAEERAREDRRRALELSLARVRGELARATRPPHRAMLERAAAALELELTALVT
jgi:hypothetical protein